MDESEANLSVFSSLTTIRENQVKCFEVLNNFIKKSKHVILASAFITQKTIDFARSLDNLKSIVFINNIRQPILKRAYRCHEDILTIKLIESIQRGEKNFVVFSTKKQLNIVNDIIRGMAFYKSKNILIYSSDMDDSQIETLQDIHKNWGEADLVMTSPSITVGNSYKPNIADFDNIFCFAAPTCCVCDTFQSIKRVRETKSNNLFFSLPDKVNLDRNKRFSGYKLDILQNYDLINKQKTIKMKTLIQELINNYKNNLQVYENNYNKLYMLQNTLCNDRKKTPKSLKDIVLFNYKEQTISDCYYEQMFIKFLEINNYQYTHNDTDISGEETSKYEDLNKQSISAKISYHHIPIIINQDIEIELTHKQTHKKATKLEKLQLEKHYMLQKINSDISENYKAALFELFISPSQKHVFHNIFEENSNDLDRSLLRTHHIDESTKENLNIKPIQLSYILKINQELGITNTSIIKNEIPREKIESLSKYFQKEHGNINIAFGFSKSKSDKFNFANNLILLKKMYKSWSNSEFKSSVLDNDKKVIKCDFIPNICFYNDGAYENPFKVIDIMQTNLTKIPSISETLSEQSNIERQLQEIKDRKIKRELDRENERIEDEKQTLLLIERERFLDEQQTIFYNMNKKCISCKNIKCNCVKIDSFFK